MEFLQDISKVSLSKAVMAHIKTAILNGQLKYDQKIPTEREMAAGFNVSRNMVREAIRALEIAGYLEVRQGPKGGAFVREFTPDRLSEGFLDYYLAKKLTMEELNTVRLHIEPEVARLAARNITPESAGILRGIIGDEYMADAIEDRVESLTKFHMVLAGMCGNFFYEIIINILLSITKEIVVAGYRAGDTVVHGLNQHHKILKAVMDGKPEKASKAMYDHLTQFSNGILEIEKKYRVRIIPK